MYRKTLHINLFGVSGPLVAALQGIAPLERFTHELSALDDWDDDAFLAGDIVIADAALLEKAHGASRPSRALKALSSQRRQQRGESFSAFVIVADAGTLAAWDADDYALVDAAWIAPLDETRLAFEFARLQREALLASDLRLTRTYLDTAIDSTPELIWFKDARGSHLKVNDAFCATVEKTKRQVEGRGHYFIWDITPEEYATGEYVCLESEDETMEAGRTCLFDEQVKTKRGMRQFKTYKSPLFDEDGRTMGTVGIAHDVTDLGNIATELDILINALPFSVVIEDADGIILNANRETETYFKVDRHRIVGRHIKDWRRIVFGDELAQQRQIHEDREFEAVIDGERKVLEMNKTPIVDVFGNKTGQMRIYRDVTEARRLEERAVMNARTDYLTGLYNRRYFYEYLEERDRAEPLSLVTLDLDDFKDINDQYGHAVGDEALLKVGTLLRQTFPEGLAIRWGGDEFVVAVFGERDPRELREQAEGLLAKLCERSTVDEHARPLTGSIGIVTSDDQNFSIDELIRRSDEALYRAKRAGKSQCCVYGEGEPAR